MGNAPAAVYVDGVIPDAVADPADELTVEEVALDLDVDNFAKAP